MNNEYLTTLYRDFANKINSINVYIKKIHAETGEINQATYAWLSKLKKKHDTLENFQKSRQRAIPNTPFSIEPPPTEINPSDNSDLKKIDSDINASSEQINYLFKRAEQELSFLTQSYSELQDLVNGIYDQFQNIFDKM